MPICPNCGNQAAENAVFCDQCGTRMPAPAPEPAPVEATGGVETAGSVPDGVLTCPDCGAENVPGVLFCDECGSPLEAPDPVAAEPAFQEPSYVEPTAVEPAVPEAEPVASVVEPAVAVEPVVAEPVVDVEPVVEVEPVLEAEPVVEAEPVAEAEPVFEAEPIIEAAPIEQPAPSQDLYCPTCGAEVEPGESFCANCGAGLDAVAPAPEIVPEEPILDESPLAAAPPVEEAEVVIEEVVIEAPVAGADEARCPICGANVLADQAFCAGCGAALEPAPTDAAVAPAPVAPVEPEPVVVADPALAQAVSAAPGGAAYVELADSGAQIPLVDQPALLIGRLDEISGIYPDIDLTPHGGDEAGVSRRHAQLIQELDAWYVLDLDSTNGTFVNGVELTPNTRSLLSDGDQITMGELQLVFHAH